MEWKSLFVSRHALQRMFSRGIAMATVRAVLAEGVVVENYPDDNAVSKHARAGLRVR